MYKLMIVDDSNVIRNRIERNMAFVNIDVVALAEDGVQAVEMYKKYRPDIITMDLTMPNMDGLECIRQIRAINSNVSILVISAIADRSTGLRSLQLGARGFIFKPFNDEQLINALKKLIEHHHTRF